jgi:hypothetical protein
VKAAKLPAGHHVELPADHYSGVIYLPRVVKEFAERMTAGEKVSAAAAGSAN